MSAPSSPVDAADEAGPSSLARMTADLKLGSPGAAGAGIEAAQPPSPGAAAAAIASANPQAHLQRLPTGGPPSGALSAGGGGARPPGGGGPPPRMQGRGGPPPGGIGSLASINSRAKAMASGPLPPSLQAKLAANANRGSSGGAANNLSAMMGHDQRLDSSALLGRGGAAAGPGLGSLRASPLPRVSSAPPTTQGAALAAAPGGGIAARRPKPGFKLSDMGINVEPPQASPAAGAPGAAPGKRLAPPGRLSAASGGLMSSAFANFSNVVDPSGRLNFDGKAVLHKSGVEFRNGTSFKINMEDLELLDELGKGNYGTVRKVRHNTTRVEMAMKEIRLELDELKLNAIIMELDILHRATAPEIVEFYGAFFVESCVYYCMEFMDAGSLENLYDGPCSLPEDVLARVVGSMVRGLRFLKDELQIMHRDVKPTNVLVNTKGEVKLCDFGVSGQLEKSLAKTNIGCQSYMAPERIKGESQNLLGTYTVASDVWSLGLSIVETTLGTYPYPPETYSNVFAQLQAIVHGDPPQLPALYSDTARDFVARCLEKVPDRRATYADMMNHAWLVEDARRGKDVDMEGWVAKAIEARHRRKARESAANIPADGRASAPPP